MAPGPPQPAEHRDQGWFECCLDDQPDFLVPALVCNPSWRSTAGLLLNPHCYWPDAFCVPAEVGEALVQLGLATGRARKIIFVADHGRGQWLLFSVGPKYAAIFDEIFVRKLRPTHLAPDVIATLLSAHVLIDPGQEATAHTKRSLAFKRAAAGYAAHGYAPMCDLLHPFHLGALRRYFRRRVRSGQIALGDGQSPLRYVAHNDPVARFFHQQLTSTASLLAGQELKPSYVYFAAYKGGAELPRHTDREQCEHSITLLIDYLPEPEGESPWPIKLHPPEGLVSVSQSIGDALMYRGRFIPHARDTLPARHFSMSLFFHYVSREFAGPLD
jgi:hypothetical protein